MTRIFIFILLCLLTATSTASTSKKSDAAKKENNNDHLISKLYGRWEGNVDYQYFENNTQNDKYTHAFGVDIRPTNLEFFNKNDAGEWVKISDSFANSFTFLAEKNTISGYFLTSGTDEDGLWVESQNLYITLKDENTLLIYSMRAVNNTDIKDSKPGTKWMQMGVGELKKK